MTGDAYRPGLVGAEAPEPHAGLGPAGDIPIAGPWACFHCGDVFHDEREARLHFGPNEEYIAACVIKSRDRTLLHSLREAEGAAAEAWGLLHSESSDFAKAYHSMVARHSQALIRAEEAGYERGLYDSGRDELLAALKGALGALEQDYDTGCGYADADWEGIAFQRLEAARAAIAKAEGK